MYTVEMDIVGTKPIVFGKYVDAEDLPAEKGMKEWERLNKHYYLKAHTDDKGNVVMSPFAIRNCICTGAQKAGEKFKGMKTWAGVFKTGFSCPEEYLIKVNGKPIKAKDLKSWTKFLPQGVSGTGVQKTFPIIKDSWSVHVILVIEDDIIPAKKVEEYVVLAGQRVGLGSFRKENNGIWGTFDVKNFKVRK
jgi:hypothetical protein